MIHLLHPKFIEEFENDARTQAKFHQRAAYFWLICMVLVPFLSTFRHDLAALLIMEVSLYANFATEFGSLSGAQASMKADRVDVHGNARVDIFVDEAQHIPDKVFDELSDHLADHNTHKVEL